ncbi:transmembrane reductase CYB561D2-like [Tribolium madens]|uniref:transmembrane reductase CYB561D2-like n=1 Tax=Tribolium madens TaxID=41895 RepID=UPI001CF7604C|nr:transmembrane reductase CYB561D2-like [Tribolium madens]
MVAEKVALTERFMWIFNTIFHQIFAVVTIFILWTIFYNYVIDSYFTWHMVLATVAYVPLMGEAIILFSSDNIWTLALPRPTKYWLHGILLFLSAILVTTGIALMVDHNHGKHFHSTHGWTGLVSWIFVLLSQILGLAAAKSHIFTKIIPPVTIKFLHNFLGILGYVFGIVSLAFGLETAAFTSFTSRDARIATFSVLGLATFWSLLAAFKSGFAQIGTILKRD